MKQPISEVIDPLAQLLQEHEAFRDSCAELSTLLDRLESEGYRASLTSPDYVVLLRTRETIREHLNVHLVKEEEIFFPRLERLVPQGRVKFLFLNYDHEFLRIYFRDFDQLIEAFDADRMPMHMIVSRLIRLGRLIINNLIKHILAEDSIYFELAESGFSPDELLQMGMEMKELEARLREA